MKLINSEYTLEQTRQTIIEGLKGYERLLSLSRDMDNLRWKPLHMAAGWNSRNRRVAKQRSKTNWYKGKPEVEPPSYSLQEERGAKFSIHKEVPGQVQVPTDEDGTERSGQQELGN